MVYKKYIQRNGKLYGPYIYQSKRVDGKVVSEYYGSKGSKQINEFKPFNYKKIFLLLAGVLLIGIMIYFFAFYNQNRITGKTVFGADISYKQGEPLEGILKFSLKEGELIPESSKLVFENLDKTYDFDLVNILDKSSLEGDYYLEEQELSGRGAGYGIEGDKIVYPEIKFVLQIYKEENEELNSTNVSEHISDETNAPITGNSVKSSGRFFTSLFGLTGMVSMNLEKEVEGVVSKDKPFTYELAEGESAELKPKSVLISGEELDDKILSLNIEENIVKITTEYFITEKGYGKEYIGDKEKYFSIDLSDLNLSLQQGNLSIKLVYEDKDILSLNTLLEEGDEISEEILDSYENDSDKEEEFVEETNELEDEKEEIKEENKTVEEIISSSLWDMGDFLTEEEKEVLIKNFNNIELKGVKSEIFNGRIIKVYEFGEYSIEYSYDASLNEDILDVQMERDRIKFLKDIANSFLKEDSSSEVIDNSEKVYFP